ncbi:hypothetical protein G7Y89_g7884 [Cudoniella acicularis]|uniref:NACHT domain-containing protein n=1 Tax=Cudoniella acicularis TaxID=354080 RepID=A0A8H4W1L9_9HELO|nr:hypothetical protein G7Y89_g7884 [Cudoniella acicularis]
MSISSPQAPSNISNACLPTSAWEKAVDKLSDEDKKSIDFTQTNKLDILKDVLAAVQEGKQKCIKKRWKYRKGDRDIIIRDKLEKIVTWVNKFKEAGDMITQYDPVHAALPWAGVRLLLQIAVNDSQIYGAMIDGVEHVSNLIVRYTILEALYLPPLEIPVQLQSSPRSQLEASIIKLFAAILIYLAKARGYYDQNTAKRMASAIINLTESTIELSLKKIETALADVDACVRMMDAQHNKSTASNVDKLGEDLRNLNLGTTEVTAKIQNLELILSQLNNPICRQVTQISDLHDSLQRSDRRELLRWVSSIQYNAHHKATGEGFLPNSGEWLLQKRAFVDWRKSSVSSALWLRGIPGSGKTRLVYSVIEHLCKENRNLASPAPLAFFYCIRAEGEPQRADPDEIIRCILKQLSFSKADLPIREPVAGAYKDRKEKADDIGCEIENLKLDECEQLIISLLEYNPATIIIDALDECDSKKRSKLMRALDNIIQKSPSLVKIFVSSRDDSDIVCRLENSPNIFIDASDNSLDIERWVSLQIDNLCDSERIHHEKDVEQELGRLPKSLHDSYQIVHQRIKNSGPASRTIAHLAITWLLCARRSLDSSTFIEAVSVDSDGNSYRISQRDLLDMCCNLVVWDKISDRFRFAHLSVQEYFQLQNEFCRLSIHKIALERCLDVFIGQNLSNPGLDDQLPDQRLTKNFNFRTYSTLYWVEHCEYIGRPVLKGKVGSFFFRNDEVAPTFKAWMSALETELDRKYQNFHFIGLVSRHDHLQRCLCRPPSPIFLAIVYQWVDFIRVLDAMPNICWEGRNYHVQTPLELAFDVLTKFPWRAEPDFLEIVELLLRNADDINYSSDQGIQILQWAVFRGPSGLFLNVVKMLLRANYQINTTNASGCTALNIAADNGHKEVVKLLLRIDGIDLEIADISGWTPLKSATRNFHIEIVKLLLDAGADVNSQNGEATSGESESARLAGKHILSLLVGVYANSRHREANWLISNTLPGSGWGQVPLLLLEAGADVNFHLDGQNTALYHAAECGDLTMVQALLEGGADVDCQVGTRGAAARKAAEAGDFEILTQLLISGGALDQTDRLCYTALQISAKKGHFKVAETLLASGANVKALNDFGWTAADLAAAWGHWEIS